MTSTPDSGLSRRGLILGGVGAASLVALGTDLALAPAAWALAQGDVHTFYAGSHWGTGFGVVDSLHPTPHQGLDIQWPQHTSVPALHAGTVASVSSNSIVGNFVVVDCGPYGFDGYSHQVNIAVSVGQSISQGDLISQIAGPGDVHGSAWGGPHLHLTSSATLKAPTTGPNRDPAPGVNDVLTGGSTPTSIPKEEENMMIYPPFNSNSSDGVIPAGIAFIQDGSWGGALRPLTAAEYSLYTSTKAQIPYRECTWDVNTVRQLTKSVGIVGFTINNGMYKPTGKIIYDSAATADYPVVRAAS